MTPVLSRGTRRGREAREREPLGMRPKGYCGISEHILEHVPMKTFHFDKPIPPPSGAVIVDHKHSPYSSSQATNEPLLLSIHLTKFTLMFLLLSVISFSTT